MTFSNAKCSSAEGRPIDPEARLIVLMRSEALEKLHQTPHSVGQILICQSLGRVSRVGHIRRHRHRCRNGRVRNFQVASTLKLKMKSQCVSIKEFTRVLGFLGIYLLLSHPRGIELDEPEEARYFAGGYILDEILKVDCDFGVGNEVFLMSGSIEGRARDVGVGDEEVWGWSARLRGRDCVDERGYAQRHYDNGNVHSRILV